MILDKCCGACDSRCLGRCCTWSRAKNILEGANAVEGTWGIREGDWDDAGEWYHGPPTFVIVHRCPRTTDADVSCLERWDMKTMHWDCPGCLTAPSERLVTLWKLMAGSSIVWEDALPVGTDLEALDGG